MWKLLLHLSSQHLALGSKTKAVEAKPVEVVDFPGRRLQDLSEDDLRCGLNLSYEGSEFFQ